MKLDALPIIVFDGLVDNLQTNLDLIKEIVVTIFMQCKIIFAMLDYTLTKNVWCHLNLHILNYNYNIYPTSVKTILPPTIFYV